MDTISVSESKDSRIKRHNPPDRKRILSAAPKTKDKCKQYNGFFIDI
jgi:hypothetical protein